MCPSHESDRRLCMMLSCVCFVPQGETKVLKLKNLRPYDFADYTCQVSVRNVCNIEDKSVTFRLTNATSRFFLFISFSACPRQSLSVLSLCVSCFTFAEISAISCKSVVTLLSPIHSTPLCPFISCCSVTLLLRTTFF